MRTIMLALGAASLAIPAGFTIPAAPAQAKAAAAKDSQDRRYHKKRYAYREWRGRDGRMYCRKPNGTTGLVVGAAAGALIGRSVDTHGERTTGTLIGAAAGALIGRDIDRNSSRKRYCR
ncbi:glycine zipper 2TM domain-containing protein [Sphingomonas canadensis]|uniref:17 kDa surface antigen n=1 Tax=Sphingomonas canadensis TaxID=1219257 RepID=A0ABW3H4Q7_9SPHN|nr:glycine zipper 2TM domain-containing protein [Sphingomonas canadensis]MCW3835919.1 glycine zipper 2TM domain-containing protein [Sphingomonas canadensis]